MRSARIGWVMAVAWLGFASCKDKSSGTAIEYDAVAADLAQLVCQPYSECDCETGLAEPAKCADAVTPALAEGIAEAELLGLQYYSECLGKANAYIDALGCKKANEVDDDEAIIDLAFEAQKCKLVAGAGNLGETCIAVGGGGFMQLGDTCKQGLTCAEVCIPIPSRVGDLCGDFAECPPGLACLDPDADGGRTCEARGAKGDKCNPHDGGGCDVDLACDPMSLSCAKLPGAGEPCPTGVCDSSSVCDGTMCLGLPGEGQPCPDGVCAEGLSCDFDTGMCSAPPGKGEMCPTGVCAAGFVCNASQTCVDAPAVACGIPDAVGFCLYRDDGVCDEPEGTGYCEEGTDPFDCGGICPTQFDGVCDEPEGSGTCDEGSDPFDCGGGDSTGGGGESTGAVTSLDPTATATVTDTASDTSTGGGPCPYAGDGECDEPEGSGLCPEGTDPLDCP
ncbi:MAG: hypothetical protein K1X88_00030 [Nannocystaceae bacterium]|nr:hypothetical protein [Nannocystaceae bacterium]